MSKYCSICEGHLAGDLGYAFYSCSHGAAGDYDCDRDTGRTGAPTESSWPTRVEQRSYMPQEDCRDRRITELEAEIEKLKKDKRIAELEAMAARMRDGL